MRRNTIPISDYVGGLSLGQAREPAALAIVEFVWGCRGFRDPYAEMEYEPDAWAYRVVHLERVPTGTSYPKLGELVKERMLSIPVYGKGGPANDVDSLVHLAVDVTEVGKPVIDLLRRSGLTPVAITIIGGDTLHRDAGGGVRVPLRELISGVLLKLQQKQLKVAEALSDAQTLLDALLNFRYTNTLLTQDPYGAWREGNDSLVLAVALACWYAERMHHNSIGAIDDDIAEAWENFTGI